MHIISGQFRGRRLSSPKGLMTRPTLSRIRQSFFDRLSPVLSGSSFLDLYAGTGSMGLEALSRGCARVVWVEQARGSAQLLGANVKLLDPAGQRTEVLVQDSLAACHRLLARNTSFDLVFLDPPYLSGELDRLASQPLDRLLAPQGRLFIQHGRRLELPVRWGGCDQKEQQRYGETCISIYTPPLSGKEQA